MTLRKKLMKAFDLATPEALDIWIEDGFPIYEGAVDSHRLIYDNNVGYRVLTATDKWRKKARQIHQAARYERGEMSPIEQLSYESMKRYTAAALEYLTRPVLWF